MEQMQKTMQDIQQQNEELQLVINQHQVKINQTQDQPQLIFQGHSSAEEVVDPQAKINLSSIAMLNQNSSHEAMSSAHRSQREAYQANHQKRPPSSRLQQQPIEAAAANHMTIQNHQEVNETYQTFKPNTTGSIQVQSSLDQQHQHQPAFTLAEKQMADQMIFDLNQQVIKLQNELLCHTRESSVHQEKINQQSVELEQLQGQNRALREENIHLTALIK